MLPQAAEEIRSLQAVLIDTAKPSGGWGYYAGHESRVEPTCWAVLGMLSGALEASHEVLSRASDFLRRAQTSSGLLLDHHEFTPNLVINALAAILWMTHPELTDPQRVSSLLSAILRTKGVQLPASTINRQDNSLVGWPWIEGTFSWVEPTAWCLLAVKKARVPGADAASRIRAAERLLVDRACEQGGWNYGNSNMMGQDLRPYISTTALALLALQDRRDEPAVVRSLDFLRAHRLKEASGMALGLTAISLTVNGLPSRDVLQELVAQYARTSFLGNLQATAMALYAMTSDQHQNRALTL